MYCRLDYITNIEKEEEKEISRRKNTTREKKQIIDRHIYFSLKKLSAHYNNLMNQSNTKGVFRTAPATPGLLINIQIYFQITIFNRVSKYIL